MIDQACFDQLIKKTPDVRAKALVLSSTIPHAGDWLRVVPSSALGLHLHNWEFQLCLQYWLGLPMVENGSKCPVCAIGTDAVGNNHINCRGNGNLIHLHDSLRDALISTAQSAALGPRKEVPSLIPGCTCMSCPADLYLSTGGTENQQL